MKLIWVLIPLLLSIMLTLGTETALAQPAIAGVEVIDVAESSVTIAWSTEEPGDSVAHYGTDKALGFTVSDSSLTSGHAIILTGLSPNTRYFLTVQSTDAEGNTSTDDNDGKSYTFKTLKTSVVRKTFVGTVVENATSTASLINATSTVTLIRQGKGERIIITLPDTYTLKTPGGPRAGTFGEGARVVIRATRTGGQWVAESVLVKPVRPNVPITGVVIGLDETTMTVMTQDGLTHTFELADDTDRPSKGEVLTVFQSTSSKAKGLVRTEQVGKRLRAFIKRAINSESGFEADYLSQLLEKHGARSIRIIDDVLPQAPDDARVDIFNAREKIRGASQAARDSATSDDSKPGQQADKNQSPAVPPGLSSKDGSEKQNPKGPPEGGGHTNQIPSRDRGLAGQPGSNIDNEQKADRKGRDSEKQNSSKGRGPGEQSDSNDDDEQRGKGNSKGKGHEK